MKEQIAIALAVPVMGIIGGLIGSWWQRHLIAPAEARAHKLAEQNLVHAEAQGIWEDAAEWRQELKRERDELRAEVAQLNEKIDRLSAQLTTITRLTCAKAPECADRKEVDNGTTERT